MSLGLRAGSGQRLGPGFLDDLPIPGDELVIAGRYRVLATIGRGGMGVVYKARQENLDRVVAVKMLVGGVHASDEFKQRFIQEAKTAAPLKHPSIVTLHDWGEDKGHPFFTMEYVEGRSLADLLKEGPLDPMRAAQFIATASRAVQYAHERGILHRDLKPSNIILAKDGTPKITDFGLAKRLHEDPELTLPGQTVGSPGYLPPEQVALKHGPAQPASDVYGLGATLYCLLTGRPPFLADTLAKTLAQVEHDEPTPLRRINRAVPRDLETVCLKCLEKEPSRRYASAQQLADDLEKWRTGQPIQARPAGPVERAWKWARRYPVIAGLCAALLVVALVGVAAVVRERREAHANAEARHQQQAEARRQTLAEERRTQPLRQAEAYFNRDKAAEGIAVLAAALRRDPLNTLAGARLLSALVHRRWYLRIGQLRRGDYLLDWCAGGRWAVTSAPRQNTTTVWKFTAEPVPVWTTNHNGRCTFAEFSPDGQRLIASIDNGRPRIWEAGTGRLLAELEHRGPVAHAAFSPDGQRLLTLTSQNALHVWEVSTGQLVAGPLNHSAPLDAAVFSSDGRWLLTESEEHFRVWEAASGKLVLGPLPARGDANRRSKLELAPGTMLRETPTRHPCARFHPNGRWLLTWTTRAYVHDITTGQFISSMRPEGNARAHGSNNVIHIAVFSPDGTRLAIAAETGTTRVYDTLSGQTISGPMRHTGLDAGVETEVVRLGVEAGVPSSSLRRHERHAPERRRSIVWKTMARLGNALAAVQRQPAGPTQRQYGSS